MILREKTPRGLSRLGWAMMAVALALMPLMPTLGRGEPKREPVPLTMNGLLSAKSCVACHAPPQASKVLDEDLHGRIIRLMAALKKQRDQAEKTEKELRSVLDKFEKALEKPKKAEAKPNLLEEQRQKEMVDEQKRDADRKQETMRLEQKRIELELRTTQRRLLLDQQEKVKAEQDKQKQLEQELKRLREKVERLQRELEGKREKPQEQEVQHQGGEAFHMNQKAFQIPFSQQQASRVLKKLSLFERRHPEKQWRLVGRSKDASGSFDFTAPADGVYDFAIQVEGDSFGDHTKPNHSVIIDTVAPLIKATLRDLGDDTLEMKWTVKEAHPDLGSMGASYRVEGEKEWREFPVKPAIQGKALLDAVGKVAEVRLRMKDKAGNQGETIVKP